MRKTTIVIDDDLVARAAAALGTRGIKATVDRALEQAIALAARQDSVEQLETMRGLQLEDADVMASAWR